MRKRKVLFITLFAFLVVSLLLFSLYVYSQSFDYDNESSILIAEDNLYSKEEIDKLEDEILFSNMYSDYPFGKFNLQYRPECIRMTPFGYYAVLMHEDDSLCFVFWTFEKEIYSIYRTNGFVTSDQFRDSVEIGKSTLEEIRNSGFDFFGYPSSKTIASAHICTDGILVVEYDDNCVVESVSFFSNEELLKTDDNYLKMVPYILPKDKTVRQG